MNFFQNVNFQIFLSPEWQLTNIPLTFQMYNKCIMVAGSYINIIKTTFDCNMLVYIKPLNSMDTQKHGKKEKLSIK